MTDTCSTIYAPVRRCSKQLLSSGEIDIGQILRNDKLGKLS